MPYGGTTPEQDAAIERCVTKLVRSGKSKVSAIRICKHSIIQADKKGSK